MEPSVSRQNFNRDLSNDQTLGTLPTRLFGSHSYDQIEARPVWVVVPARTGGQVQGGFEVVARI